MHGVVDCVYSWFGDIAFVTPFLNCYNPHEEEERSYRLNFNCSPYSMYVDVSSSWCHGLTSGIGDSSCCHGLTLGIGDSFPGRTSMFLSKYLEMVKCIMVIPKSSNCLLVYAFKSQQ